MHSARCFPPPSSLQVLLAIALVIGFTWVPAPWGDPQREGPSANTLAAPESVVQAPAENEEDSAGLSILSQDSGGMAMRYRLPSFHIGSVTVNGRSYDQVTMPGIQLPYDPGAPDLPARSEYLAIPCMAQAVVRVTASHSQRYSGVQLPPAPRFPLDPDSAPAYEEDPRIYEADAPYPSSPVWLTGPFQIRGVDAALLSVVPFEYNPVRKELVVFDELEFRIDYVGGTGEFGRDAYRSRYWEPILRKLFVNYAALPRPSFLREMDEPAGYGYEHVIICPDKAGYLAWVDTIASWRRLEGISTHVFTTQDAGDIRAFLSNAYEWPVKPAGVLLIGDNVAIPSGTSPYGGLSDNVYVDVVPGNNPDGLPEMAIGRLAARDTSDLRNMVLKMMRHEQTPPQDSGFYETAMAACCHDDVAQDTPSTNVLATEIFFGFQTRILGRQPIREYTALIPIGEQWPPGCSQCITYFGPDCRDYLIPGGPQDIPDDAWQSTPGRIVQDINNGTYLVVHHGHGGGETWPRFWACPVFGPGNVDQLTNDVYPWVFDFGCHTGNFGYEGLCLAQELHRSEHGALGLTAATHQTFPLPNLALDLGIQDALWDEYMPEDYSCQGISFPEGSVPRDGTVGMRPAFALVYGKYFLSRWPYIMGPPPGEGTRTPPNGMFALYTYHHFGDPFQVIYSEAPSALTVEHGDSYDGGDFFAIRADAGAMIGLTIAGEIVGVAQATGDWQEVQVEPALGPGQFRITVTKPNCLRYDRSIPIAGSRVWTIKPDGSGDAPTIQAGIDLAATGDVVVLDPGVYSGAGNRTIRFHGKAVEVRSASRNPADCVIDCAASPSDQANGFVFDQGENSASVLCGVTIRDGWVKSLFGDASGGGGIRVVDASPIIVDCVVEESFAVTGGGIFCSGGSPRFLRCAVTSNSSGHYSGGGLMCQAGGSPTLQDCRILGNLTTGSGGGVSCANGSHLTLTSCVITGNRSSMGGGGVCRVGPSGLVKLHGCTVAGNRSFGSGGGIWGACTVCTTILWGNGAAGAWGDWDADGGVIPICCSDWDSTTVGGFGPGSTEDEWATKVLHVDPMFCEPESYLNAPTLSGDYRLDAVSPCANDPVCGLVGALPAITCMTLYVGSDGSGPYGTIQAALDDALDGDVVLLGDGVFSGAGNRDLDFHGKSVTLRSMSGVASSCVIDCAGSPEEPHRGFWFHSGEGPETLVQSITITNGYATDSGGAILCAESSSPRFVGCIFRGNIAHANGGGLHCATASPSLVTCRFLEDVALAGSGGGMSCAGAGASPTLTHCVFAGGSAGAGGGAGYCALEAQAAFDHCTLSGNTDGGLRVAGGAHAAVDTSIVALNLSGPAVVCETGGTAFLACSDVYGNEGGDWVGCIETQQGADGNFSADPLFCGPDDYDFAVAENSPCAPEQNPVCGCVGSAQVGCHTLPLAVDGDDAAQMRLEIGRPNPFTRATTISYSIPSSTGQPRATLAVFDAGGRRVRTLADGPTTAGSHVMEWDGLDQAGQPVSAGVYFCRMVLDGKASAKRLVLMK